MSIWDEKSFWDEKKTKRLFQGLLNEKPSIKRVSNIDLRQELLFCEKLNIGEISKAFKRYARCSKVEIIDSKVPLAQLKTSKLSIK